MVAIENTPDHDVVRHHNTTLCIILHRVHMQFDITLTCSSTRYAGLLNTVVYTESKQ